MVEPSMQTETNSEINQNISNGEVLEGDLNNENNDQSCYQYPSLFSSKTLLELCNSTWYPPPKSSEEVQPYLRGCKWSPDGTCCLTVVNNDGVHVTELPHDLYSENPTRTRNIDVLESAVHIKESGLVYDFCWYPGMNSQIPETCCFLTTKKNSPIQMWDAFNGSLRCSYRGFNAVDEMEPALSITFSSDASRLIGGYKKVLRTFDIDRPGRDFSEHKISSPASCLATNSNLLAVGSWNTVISLYNVSEMGTYKSIGKMHGHAGGVTHIKFTPDGLKLVSGARKDHRLLVWDIRYYRRPLNILSRAVDTNQRVYFDISPCGKYLVSGGTNGILKVWDVERIDWKNEIDVFEENDLALRFPLHRDCCNSVSIHPLRPILATGSGQYHLQDPAKLLDQELQTNDVQIKTEYDSSLDISDSNVDKDNLEISDSSVNKVNMDISDFKVNKDKESTAVEVEEDMKYSSFSENCLVFWWIGELTDLDM